MSGGRFRVPEGDETGIFCAKSRKMYAKSPWDTHQVGTLVALPQRKTPKAVVAMVSLRLLSTLTYWRRQDDSERDVFVPSHELTDFWVLAEAFFLGVD